jgi:hypothetical protein
VTSNSARSTKAGERRSTCSWWFCSVCDILMRRVGVCSFHSVIHSDGAPETRARGCKIKATYGLSADVWSVGVLLARLGLWAQDPDCVGWISWSMLQKRVRDLTNNHLQKFTGQ